MTKEQLREYNRQKSARYRLRKRAGVSRVQRPLSPEELRLRRQHVAEFYAYSNARARCVRPKHKRWKDYGARGIKFEFTSFEQFFTHIGPRPTEFHSLDRYPDNDGNYAPGNVRWATRKEQRANSVRLSYMITELEKRGYSVVKLPQ